jgi:hypothetical protein
MMARPAPAVRAHRAARRHRTFANGKIPAARSADRIAGPGSILRPRAAKIIGPLGLALIAGSSDLVSPTATIDALFPAFLFLAFWYGQAALMFLLLGFENQRPVDRGDQSSARHPSIRRARSGSHAGAVAIPAGCVGLPIGLF